MKLAVMTDDGRIIALFEDAEEMDYLDYSAELDAAIAKAVVAEGTELPAWLRPPPTPDAEQD
ncbi:MAG: hypothetical protein ACREJ9_04755 [Candidatus Rokuibacteriota bacterium]